MAMYEARNYYRLRVFINAIESNIRMHRIATQTGANFISCAASEWECRYHGKCDFQVAKEARRP